jgi:hypothetical protein
MVYCTVWRCCRDLCDLWAWTATLMLPLNKNTHSLPVQYEIQIQLVVLWTPAELSCIQCIRLNEYMHVQIVLYSSVCHCKFSLR